MHQQLFLNFILEIGDKKLVLMPFNKYLLISLLAFFPIYFNFFLP
tara:strand:- start:1069 stop:1203 length:135 start_codon:yes stop_codon:yes gene_type:complete